MAHSNKYPDTEPLVQHAMEVASSLLKGSEDDQSEFSSSFQQQQQVSFYHDPEPVVTESSSSEEDEDCDAENDTAMDFSNRASHLLQENDLQGSIALYQQAADVYCRQQHSVVAAVNAAGCFRNMGAASRMLRQYDDAIRYLQRAEQLYQHAQHDVERWPAAFPAVASGEQLSLDLMITETMQSRATFHFQNKGEVQAAVNCHEECIRRLLAITDTDRCTQVDGVVFVGLAPHQMKDLLVVSIENLGGMYRTDSRCCTDDGLESLETAVDKLKSTQQEEDGESALKPITQSLRYMSEVYLERGQMDKAVDSMHDAMDVELSSSDTPSEEILDAMEKMGVANEQLENHEKALACYEKALLARSRIYGDNDISVAKSLVNIARVMEKQGNAEGSLDIYGAAHAIYAVFITAPDFDCDLEDAKAVLQLVPELLAQERFDEAKAYLTKCLEVAEQSEERDGTPSTLDKSRIYYDLGRASMGIDDFVSATIFLMEVAKVEGSVSEEQAVTLLNRVELLQRERSRIGIRVSQSWDAGDTQTRAQVPSNSSNDTSVPSKIGLSNTVEFFPAISAATRSRTQLLSHGNNSSGSTIPTSEASEMEKFKTEDLFNTPKFLEFSRSTEAETDEVIPSLDVNTKLDTGAEDDGEEEAQTRLVPSDTFYSDDPGAVVSPSSSDTNGKSSRRGRSLRRNTSPRKSKDDRSRSASSQQRSTISNFFGDGLLRLRKQGFASLPEERGGAQREEVAKPEEVTEIVEDERDLHFSEEADDAGEKVAVSEDESRQSGGPVLILTLDGSMDDMSEVTWTPGRSEETTPQGTSQDWWWGVTSEGFGRLFPSNYVSQAVQVADNFLSANAIHSLSKLMAPGSNALASASDEESTGDHEGSAEHIDFASNAGVGSMAKPMLTKRGTDQRGLKSTNQSSSPLAGVQGGKDVASEIIFYRDTLVSQRREYGDQHANIATTLFTLAVLHSQDQDTKTAAECAIDALQIQQFNGQDEDAARSLHFLGDLSLHQKQYQQALEYYGSALKHEESCFGYYCDAIAKTRNCIGTTKLMQAEFREAMDSHEEALRVLKECHGEDLKHPLVAETLCQIGSVYYGERNSPGSGAGNEDGYTTFIEMGMLEVIGRAHEDRGTYRMAISFYEEKLQVLESKRKTRDITEEIATTLNGLGMLSCRAGLFGEALGYYEKAYEIQSGLRCDEVDLATSRVLTATAQFQLGDWRLALRLFTEALKTLKKKLGGEHETVAATYFQIGLVNAKLCEYDNAMDSFSEALEIQSSCLGEAHPATLRTRREIGNLYSIYEAELESAFEHFEFVLTSQRNLHGERHPNVAETLHSIGVAHARRKDYTEALRALEECYYMRVDFLGWDHPLQASTLYDIAKIHQSRGRVKKALQICKVVISIQHESLGERHIDVAKTLLTQGSCFVTKGETDDASTALQESLHIAETLLPAGKHPLVAEIHTEIGALYLRKCQFDCARQSIQRALEMYNESLVDEDYHGIQHAKEILAQVERDEMLCV